MNLLILADSGRWRFSYQPSSSGYKDIGTANGRCHQCDDKVRVDGSTCSPRHEGSGENSSGLVKIGLWYLWFELTLWTLLTAVDPSVIPRYYGRVT
ncbi:hypothetical protein EVAR_80511_1 [Eumeta japonica]|uniref:Uncharacterized protein n=1 Tax=Eumeta variegata TaxID=151549 RepID=A0A4C1TNP7_EUMVA|nr:hypothetical protein EVAR_80511_1 [Eumeta japonica]